MSSRTRSRKNTPDLGLEVADQSTRVVRGPIVPWLVAAGGGGLISAASTWVVVCGLATLGWLAVPDIAWSQALRAGTAFWLLSYFAGGTIAEIHITIAPLGLTAVNFLIALGLAGFAANQARSGAPQEMSQSERRRLALKVSGVFVGVQVSAVLVASFVVATPQESARALLGALAVAGIAAVAASAGATQWRLTAAWPPWAQALPRAIAAGVLVCIVGGCLAAIVALIQHRSSVIALHQALAPGVGGGLLLLVIQLLWLPNVVIWSTAWVMGGGFSVGGGSVVLPTTTQVPSVLPGIPILGAVPSNGTHSPALLWWLLTGVVAGVVAAMVVLRARPRARVDETAVVGGLSGAVSGLVLAAVASLAGGDLGSVRLVGLGARIGPLAILAATLMGLAGLVTGVVHGVLRPSIDPGETPTELGADEDTLDLSFPARERPS